MKVLAVHNYYKFAGGEDVVFANETALLRAQGHQVVEYTASNDAIDSLGRLSASVNTIWSRSAKRALAELIAREKPDVAHFHNTFMMLSPSVYYACRAAGVPVVQTLHNYRLMCPAAIFFRQGKVCEDCMGRVFAYPGVVHGCYRGSKAGTAVVATMLTAHRLRGTWTRAVDRYIVLTEFARQKFIEGGLPADRLALKPNFLNDAPGVGHRAGDYFLFTGRWNPEKGILTVLRAWRRLGASAPPLKVLGEGPLEDEVRALARELPMVEMVGQLPRDQVIALLGNARAMLQASEWYEGLPMTLIEAFACGVPVIASRIGAPSLIVRDGVTGLHFMPGDPDDLARVIAQFQALPADGARQLGDNARAEFEAHYTPEQNYTRLMAIYDEAIANARRS